MTTRPPRDDSAFTQVQEVFVGPESPTRLSPRRLTKQGQRKVTGEYVGPVIEEVYGGTGHGVYALGDVLYADSTSSLARLALGGTDEVLSVNAGALDYRKVVNAMVDNAAAIAWSKIDKTGSSLADLATRSASDLATGNLGYARLPTGGGTWANGGALSITGGITTVAGLVSTLGLDVTGAITGNIGVRLTASSRIIQHAADNDFVELNGGVSATGALLRLYGGSHASFATHIRFLAGTTLVLVYEAAVTKWSFGSPLLAVDMAALTATTGTFSGVLAANAGLTGTTGVFSSSVLAAYYQDTVSTPAQFTANVDNFSLGAFSTLRVSSDASRDFTGITNGVAGRRLRLINIGSFNIVLVNDATSTAGNRFLTGTGANITMAALDVVDLQYDNTTQRWRVVGHY